MAYADYMCIYCGKTYMIELPQDEVIDRECCQPHPTPHKRIWTPPTINQVRGAGESPSRT